MAILKCKMCGGDMEVSADKTFGTCECCGTVMTLPKIDDEQRAEAFNRGNHFRRLGEFDKALRVYERLVQEIPGDAEAHWCCALCRFGIEYVEDPTTYEYIPTCHRLSFDNFTEDVDYLAAIEHSDGITKKQYMKDGAKIQEVQRAVLATSQKEEPFDVFICYKESDASGNRTVDSTLAQDIYYQLTNEGLRVFYAKITLEDKVGSEYEPYIFAALNSAKVMVIVGTSAENLNAVWVKNEWSRFLSIVKKDRTKVILPCYRDMDPYDMPEQLSVLQSYDMSKIGFIQDLIRGIKKITDAEKLVESAKEAIVVNNAANTNTEPLLKRAFMFLEDGKWNDADEYCEKVLDLDPENAQAYLGKLMAELHVKREEELRNCREPFDSFDNYVKATKYGDEVFRSRIDGYIYEIKERIQKKQEEEDKLLHNVITAIQLKSVEEKRNSLISDLSQFKKVEGRMQEILCNYDDKLLQIKGYENDIVAKEGETERLQTKKAALGIFAGKEKKQIDEEIEELKKSITLTQGIIQQKKKQYGVCLSKEDIEHNLQQAKKNIEEIETTINKLAGVKSELSYEQAKAIFLNNKAIRERTPIKIELEILDDGENFYFGRYGIKPIEWRILYKQENKVLLIAEKALSLKPYNNISCDVTWETCTLRDWLNSEFLMSAFTDDERKLIKETALKNDANPKYGTTGGNDTQDKIFLLSIDEAEKYFKNDEERICKKIDSEETWWWWLRSPGNTSRNAAEVCRGGGVAYHGDPVYEHRVGVRPALWINLES